MVSVCGVRTRSASRSRTVRSLSPARAASCSCDSKAQCRYARKSTPIEPSGGAAMTSCSMSSSRCHGLCGGRRRNWRHGGNGTVGVAGRPAARITRPVTKACLAVQGAHAAPPSPCGWLPPGPEMCGASAGADDEAHVDGGQRPTADVAVQDHGGASGFGIGCPWLLPRVLVRGHCLGVLTDCGPTHLFGAEVLVGAVA